MGGGEGGDFVKFTVQFFDGNDERTEPLTMNGDWAPLLPIGTKVKLMYDPEQPDRMVFPELPPS